MKEIKGEKIPQRKYLQKQHVILLVAAMFARQPPPPPPSLPLAPAGVCGAKQPKDTCGEDRCTSSHRGEAGKRPKEERKGKEEDNRSRQGKRIGEAGKKNKKGNQRGEAVKSQKSG